MKKVLLSSFLALALVLSACQNDSDVTSPETTSSPDQFSSAALLLEQLDLSNDQIAFADEMYYMDEDMSVLLNDAQKFTFDLVTDGFGDRALDRDGRDHPFPGRPGPVVDMAALMHFRMIMKACEPTEEQITAIREAIAESHRTRAELVKNATDRDALARALAAEHDDLMNIINRIVGPRCMEAVEALKAEIQAKRDAAREKMAERRMEAELQFLTKLLSLTDDQITTVKRLIVAKQDLIAELREQYKGDPEGLRAALERLMNQFDEDMLDLLDDEQDAIYMKWRGRTTGDRPDPGDKLDQEIARLTKLLGLTERQAQQLKEAMMKKMEAEKLAFEENQRDRAALAEALKNIQQRYLEALKGFLTPEQFERYIKIMHQRGPVDRGPIGRGPGG